MKLEWKYRYYRYIDVIVKLSFEGVLRNLRLNQESKKTCYPFGLIDLIF